MGRASYRSFHDLSATEGYSGIGGIVFVVKQPNSDLYNYGHSYRLLDITLKWAFAPWSFMFEPPVISEHESAILDLVDVGLFKSLRSQLLPEGSQGLLKAARSTGTSELAPKHSYDPEVLIEERERAENIAVLLTAD